MAKKWIQEMEMKKGALRKTAGVKKGKKIPASKLNKLAKSKNKKTAKRVNLAKTLSKMSK